MPQKRKNIPPTTSGIDGSDHASQGGASQQPPTKKRASLLVPVAVVGFLVLGALGYIGLTQSDGEKTPMQERTSAQAGDLYLAPDTGLNIEFVALGGGFEVEGAEGGDIRERVMYERYRFFNADTDERIDLAQGNIRAFVTLSNGQEEEITTEGPYYLLAIFPFSLAGEYVFRVEMPDGTERVGSFVFSEPQPTELILREETTGTGGESLQVLEMSGLRLSDAEAVYHVRRDNSVDSLSANEGGYVTVEQDVLNVEDHVFLAKQGGVWHWAVHVNPAG